MKVTIELQHWVVAMLLRARIHPNVCGPTIEERIVFWANDMAVAILDDQAIEQDREADQSQYRSLRLSEKPKRPGDDDIPF